MSERVLGLIPAKGGSTRLAKKNILPVGGKPLINWAFDAVRCSEVCDQIILSTESQEVADVARSAGMDVPFLRPDHLARDPAGIVDVALHALDELEKAGQVFTTLVIAAPTCPLRTSQDVRDAYKLFQRSDRPFVMSVNEFSHTPFAALRMSASGRLSPCFPEYFGRKSQELPKTYRPNGAVHVLDVPAFRLAGTYFGDPLIAYVMPRERSYDIDTALDISEVEAFLATQGPR